MGHIYAQAVVWLGTVLEHCSILIELINQMGGNFDKSSRTVSLPSSSTDPSPRVQEDHDTVPALSTPSPSDLSRLSHPRDQDFINKVDGAFSMAFNFLLHDHNYWGRACRAHIGILLRLALVKQRTELKKEQSYEERY